MDRFPKTDDYKVHLAPVWREEANFLIMAHVEEADGRNMWEQLWALQLDESRFRLCCIPFFVYDLQLGDEVETDENHVVQNVVKPSNQRCFRIWFGHSKDPGASGEILDRVEELGVEMEWYSKSLVAVSAVDPAQVRIVADYLQDRQKAGLLEYDTGQQSPR